MIYLTDTLPTCCPACQRPYVWHGYGRADFFNGCSQVCTCGAQFQYVATHLLAEAARAAGGDLLVR